MLSRITRAARKASRAAELAWHKLRGLEALLLAYAAANPVLLASTGFPQPLLVAEAVAASAAAIHASGRATEAAEKSWIPAAPGYRAGALVSIYGSAGFLATIAVPAAALDPALLLAPDPCAAAAISLLYPLGYSLSPGDPRLHAALASLLTTVTYVAGGWEAAVGAAGLYVLFSTLSRLLRRAVGL